MERWHARWEVAHHQQSLEEPSIQDESWHLQQGDEDEVHRVGLPQQGSDWNEGRGRAHLSYHQAELKHWTLKHWTFNIKTLAIVLHKICEMWILGLEYFMNFIVVWCISLQFGDTLFCCIQALDELWQMDSVRSFVWDNMCDVTF